MLDLLKLELQVDENHPTLELNATLIFWEKPKFSLLIPEPSLHRAFFMIGSHSIVQVSLELMALQPQPPEYWDCRYLSLTQLNNTF